MTHSQDTTIYYDAIAPGYDELYREEQERKLAIIINELLKQDVKGTLLDVGCGTGFSLDILHQQTGLRVVGVEPSTHMTSQYQGTQQLLVCPAEHLPFPDESFDAVISITAIHHFTAIEQGISQIRRVTKPGGRILISCLKQSPTLTKVCNVLGDSLLVERVIEEEKDVVFVCRRT